MFIETIQQVYFNRRTHAYVGTQYAMEGVNSPPGLPGILSALSRSTQSHHDCLQHGLQGTLPSGVCASGVGQPSRAGEGVKVTSNPLSEHTVTSSLSLLLSVSSSLPLSLFSSLHLLFLFPSSQLSWYQQALAGCPEFSVSQYMGDSIDLEPFKIVLNSEETKPWYAVDHSNAHVCF